MDPRPPTRTAPVVPPEPVVHRRWVALLFICLAQLMIVLDATIVNIALPSAQRDLGVSDVDRQWVITAYTLAFGGLLLLGGRIADYTGRRRTFLIGLLGFAGASALGGAAPGFGVLLAARACQGAFGALLAPSALSLLSVIFARPADRAKAFGVFGAIAAGGGSIGLVLGGLLTEYLDWRWCLYVNVPIAVICVLGWYFLPRDHHDGTRARFDVPGVLLAGLGLVAIVYGCSRAESDGWASVPVAGLLIAGVVLLAAFVVVESRVARPLLPLRVVLNRTRGGAYLAVAVAIIAMFGMLLLLTYDLQVVKGYSPVRTGIAFLPLTGAVLVSAGGIASRLLPRVPPRVLMAPGLLVAAGGLAWLSRLDATTSYASGVLPGQLLVGLGMGLVMAPALNYATHEVNASDAGVASAMANTAQQVGGSIGVALLNTVATSATAGYLAGRPKNPLVLKEGLVRGFTHGFTTAAVVLAAGALVIGVVMNTARPR
ncbi:MFS transporter [Actinoallomurus bryophytorum]|uniref:EmrB/QacA subfamily drug resistance transporter n=1 Tax=Actinoallomurus bryophytorum TaxID=1490222 RepID=A0A543CDK1_9ACTN|nr:MFS transporter [Actinoallomurus bryophytorum]TQL95017.1 EmrB/QacA subfamily drug resistance transporter [Actinoallomurus bryophytorum]